MRWLRGIGALAVLGFVLLGAPVALGVWGRLPSNSSVLARPDDGSLLLAVLTVLGWLAWAAFTASTVIEAVRLGGGGLQLHVPLLGHLQRTSAGLLLAVMALGPTPAGSPAAQPVSGLPSEARPREPRPEPPAAREDDVATEPAETYLVEPGDDLWTITERVLGAGGRWREVAAANPEVLKDPTTRLSPGTRLLLPSSATHPRRVTVERGDTLSGLALEHLGAAGRWPRIAAANRDLIDDPDHIEVGWRLDLPSAATHRTAPRPSRSDGRTAGPDGRGPAPAPDGDEDRPKDRDADRPPTPTAASTPPSGDGQRSTPAPSDAGTVVPAPGADHEPQRPTAAPSVSAPNAADDAAALPWLATFGTLAAAAILGVVEARRFLRLRERPLGRRLVSPEEGAVRLRTLLGAEQRPDRLAGLDAALRAVGRHCWESGRALPELERITVGARRITLEWASPAPEPAAGFAGTPDRWTVDLASPPAADDHPCPYPAVVSLGSTDDGDLVLVDAEQSRVLGVASDDPELRRASVAAMVVELACAPWSADVRLLVVGQDAPLVALAGGERVEVLPDVAAGLARLRSLLAERRMALGAEPLSVLRVDRDRADAVSPVVLCLLDETAEEHLGELEELLAGTRAGVAAIVVAAGTANAQWQVDGDVAVPRGRLSGAAEELLAHAIPEATRVEVAALFRAADDPASTPAPWWSGPVPAGEHANVVTLPPRALLPGGEEVDVVRVVPRQEHPRVLLIGPTDLEGARGPEPTRSRQQLVELCAWLLEHPGSTATAMANGLAVAEGTRRSNLSRLRAWLGTAPDGTPYLPDAYSGRVLLHSAVTSDWHRLQVLLQPGIDRLGDGTLVAALDLIRGAPLADAAPGQWHWAEELRTDVSCALRDVGLVLSERALQRGDIDLARWAAARALVVAAEDEQLLCARIRTEHRAGNTGEVERLVNQVTRQARVLGVDLLPETVELCQQVIEGRLRARA